MRKSLAALAVAAAILAAPVAKAESWYIGGYGALNYTHDGSVNSSGLNAEYDPGLGLAGYVGFYVQENIRLEGELSYRANDLDTVGGVPRAGEAETLALMMNALFDFKLESNIEPYLGAGIGLADANYTISGVRYDDTVLAIQMIAGLGIKLSPSLQLTVDYRLFVTDELRVGSGQGFGRVDYTNSAIAVGVRKSF